MNALKSKFFNKFFKYESYMIRNSEKENNDLEERNYKLEKENKKLSRLYEKLLEIFDKYDMILGIEKNKEDESYIIACNSDDHQIDIYLIHSYFKERPFIQSILYTNYTTHETYLEITDIQPIDNSVGNGNIMMTYFLKEAKRKNVKYISGILAEDDKDNFYRSVPYYQKFGFDVKFNKEKNSGSIRLIL